MSFMRPAASGTYFATKICGVQLDSRTRAARLHLTLNVVRPLPSGGLLETEFRNPADRTVLTVTRAVKGGERAIEMISPPMGDVRAGSYETATRLYASAERKQVLATHTYVCESLIDHRELGPEFR